MLSLSVMMNCVIMVMHINDNSRITRLPVQSMGVTIRAVNAHIVVCFILILSSQADYVNSLASAMDWNSCIRPIEKG